jgi:hypothetical protein
LSAWIVVLAIAIYCTDEFEGIVELLDCSFQQEDTPTSHKTLDQDSPT